MSNLFIIGNGFDLAHGMKTSYEDFHQYLKDTYPDASFTSYVIPDAKIMPDGSENYDDFDVVGLLLEVISDVEPHGDRWSDLETSLGFLDLDGYLNNRIEDDDDNDGADLVGAILEIKDYFSEWIEKIDIYSKSPKSDFMKLIDQEHDLFLNFNYTRTLELLYHAKNICHIHGEQGGKLLFGHGNENDYTEEYIKRHMGSEDLRQMMLNQLKKNTEAAIKDKQDFFDKIAKSVDKIYSFGFSFSKIDEVYIMEICSKLPTSNVTWYLNDYDDIAKRTEYTKVIKSCGFEGTFDTYHIS